MTLLDCAGCGMRTKSSGTTASIAVPTSSIMTPDSGISDMASAPSGGPTIFSAPFSVWFMPATRVRCCSGTISVVEACMAGHWKAPPSARMNMIR